MKTNGEIVSFDDTAGAFAYKTDKELAKTHLMFRLMNQNWLVKTGSHLANFAVKWNLPVQGLIRSTIFEQFVGGETLEAALAPIGKLQDYQVDVILDYGAEAKESESDFDRVKDEFLKVIRFASTGRNIPFIGIKLTALARFDLLEKLNGNVLMKAGNLSIDLSYLTPAEQDEWHRVYRRIDSVCRTAAQKNIGVLIDAEESWIQNTIDAVTMDMMQRYNRTQPVIFNTIQLYRHDRLAFLIACHEEAVRSGFILGAKIVRGAYMEKERKRAHDQQETDFIQPDKIASDRDFNQAIEYCLKNIETVALIIASHNEQSVRWATQLMKGLHLPNRHRRVHFSQLYGMSDNITFNLAASGFNTSKYLPYGPIHDVIPYLMRRARENSSVAGQTSRELFLIRKELERRKTRSSV